MCLESLETIWDELELAMSCPKNATSNWDRRGNVSEFGEISDPLHKMWSRAFTAAAVSSEVHLQAITAGMFSILDVYNLSISQQLTTFY